MELTERYVAEVVKRLPESQRADVAKELRGSIEDMAKDTNEREALLALGDPAALARQYQGGSSYLIGPKWFAAYVQVLKTVLCIVVPIFFIVTAAVSFYGAEEGLASVLADRIGDTFGVAASIVFWVTLTFALLERGGVALDEPDGKEVWSPDSLPPLPRERQVGLAEGVVSLLMTTAVTATLAASNHVVGVRTENGLVPFFHVDLWQVWIPVLIALGVAGVVYEAVKLKVGGITLPMLVANFAQNLATAAVLLYVVATQEVINPDFLAAMSQLTGDAAANYSAFMVWGGLLLTVGLCLQDMVESALKYAEGRRYAALK